MMAGNAQVYFFPKVTELAVGASPYHHSRECGVLLYCCRTVHDHGPSSTPGKISWLCLKSGVMMAKQTAISSLE